LVQHTVYFFFFSFFNARVPSATAGAAGSYAHRFSSGISGYILKWRGYDNVSTSMKGLSDMEGLSELEG